MSYLAFFTPLSKNIRPLSITSRTLKHAVRYLVSTNINRTVAEKQDQSKHIHPPSTRSRVIVFDIDDTLCRHISIHKPIRDNFPECPIIQWGEYQHVFLPHLQILFGYLLKHETRLVFFSSAVKERNEFLIPALLTSFWGTEKYDALRAKGQFNIHSRDDMRKGKYKEGEGHYVKDLKAVIRDGESFSDVILVDDDRSYAAYDQYPLVRPMDLMSWYPYDSEPEEYIYRNVKNGTYYMLGLFKTAFEHEKYKELALKEAFRQIVPENYKPHSCNANDSIERNMVDIGLAEVQKQIPDAILFGTTSIVR